MTNLEVFGHVGDPWLIDLVGSPAAAYELAWALTRQGVVSRVLRGAKMTTRCSLFDECGAALQSPDYFGENWAALAR